MLYYQLQFSDLCPISRFSFIPLISKLPPLFEKPWSLWLGAVKETFISNLFYLLSQTFHALSFSPGNRYQLQFIQAGEIIKRFHIWQTQHKVLATEKK
jgi:hypothetical protein